MEVSQNKIVSRAEISILVHHFYDEIRKNEILGPIFNSNIPSEKWPAHLEKLTDFWESVLFRIPKFRGSPTMAHISVDSKLPNGMQQEHFGIWLQLWFAAIDKLYPTCEVGRMAKDAARNMATGQFMAVWNHKNKPS